MGKGRTPCCEKGRVKRGPWSQAEDLKLISFIHKHGHNNWRSLPKLAGLARCGKSCRLRWVNYLRPDVKRGNFTPDEEDTIIRLQQSLGNRWSKIASHLPGRTDNEIKNVWNTHLKKKRRLLNSNNNNSTGNNTDEDDDDSQLQQHLNDINTTTVSSHAQPQQQLTSGSSANLTDDLIKTTSSAAVPSPPPCFMDISYGTIEISTCSSTTTPNPHDDHNKPEASVNFPYLDESHQLVDLWDSFSLDYNHTSEEDHLEQMITTDCMTTTAAYDQLVDGFRENYIVSCGGGDGDHNLQSSSTGTDHFGLELLASSPPIIPTADSEDTLIETYNLPWPSSPYLL